MLSVIALACVAMFAFTSLPAVSATQRAPIWTALFPSTYPWRLAVGAGRVFVGGVASMDGRPLAYATVAYDQASGRQLWSRLAVNESGPNEFRDIAVSPDGSLVFVTGQTLRPSTDEDFLTIAYDAATGSKRWSARFDHLVDGVHMWDSPGGLGVSSDGARVFVAGGCGVCAEIVAYDAYTGRQLWTRWIGADGGVFNAIAVDPDGAEVYATGGLTTKPDPQVEPDNDNYLTVGFDATTGAISWRRQLDGPAGGDEQASVMGLSSDGRRVFVSGGVSDAAVEGYLWSAEDWGTVAYRARDGATLWSEIRASSPDQPDSPSSLVVSPRKGGSVFVLGITNGDSTAVTAYAPADGAVRWTVDPPIRVLEGQVSPDGRRLYAVDGEWDAIRTVALNAETGATLWLASLNVSSTIRLRDIGVGAQGRVFVTGQVAAPSDAESGLTVAYPH